MRNCFLNRNEYKTGEEYFAFECVLGNLRRVSLFGFPFYFSETVKVRPRNPAHVSASVVSVKIYLLTHVR
jgi:hypothetical protein